MLEFLIPILLLSLVAAGWGGVQLLAKSMGTKNHIDNHGGCCGACHEERRCELKHRIS